MFRPLGISTLAWLAFAMLPEAGAAQSAQPGTPAFAGAVDAAAQALLLRTHIPGLALAVADHGRIVYARGYGRADVDLGTPVAVDTRFEIGSLSQNCLPRRAFCCSHARGRYPLTIGSLSTCRSIRRPQR